jgi:hypothetical protein
LNASPTACSEKSLSIHRASISKYTKQIERYTFDIRRTSMIKGKSFKLFVISTIITHKETVIRIEPPRKEAAPNSAYLEIHQEAYRNTSETNEESNKFALYG